MRVRVSSSGVEFAPVCTPVRCPRLLGVEMKTLPVSFKTGQHRRAAHKQDSDSGSRAWGPGECARARARCVEQKQQQAAHPPLEPPPTNGLCNCRLCVGHTSVHCDRGPRAWGSGECARCVFHRQISTPRTPDLRSHSFTAQHQQMARAHARTRPRAAVWGGPPLFRRPPE